MNEISRSVTTALSWTVGIVSFLSALFVTVLLTQGKTDPAASFVGSILAAALAVGGAFLLWQMQELGSAKRLGPAVAKQFVPLQEYLVKVAEAVGATPLDPNLIRHNRQIRPELEEALRLIDRADLIISRTWTVAYHLSAVQVSSLVDFEAELAWSKHHLNAFLDRQKLGNLNGDLFNDAITLRAQIDAQQRALDRIRTAKDA